MSLTPLYTAAELDAEITQAKADLRTARQALSYQENSSGRTRQAERERVKALQDHLEWLQAQRAALQVGSGPQAIVGRVYRG